MARIVSVRALKNSGSSAGGGHVPRIRPLAFVDIGNEDAIVSWFQDTVTELQEDHNELVRAQDRKREFYAGIQSTMSSGMTKSFDENPDKAPSQFSRVVINKLYNLIELWVAKLTRYSSNVVVNPTNNEHSDKTSAKLGKLIADNLAYVNEVDPLLESLVRTSRIDGEVYCFVDFDKDWGDYPPGAIQAPARQPVLNQYGEPVYSIDDEPLYVSPVKRIGEVRFRQVDSRFVIMEPREKYRQSDWCIEIRPRYVDELRCEFPDKADLISGGDLGPFNFPWIQLADNETIEYVIYHRENKFLAGGLEIHMTGDRVLSVAPYSMKSCKTELPMARYTCIDIPGVYHGVSILDNLMIVQVLLNNVASLAYTNASLGAHIYWLVPTQANVDLQKLRNGASVIRFTGPQGPKIETFKTIGEELFRLFEYLERWLVEGSGHQGISQGDPPPGVDAAVALGVLEEQENQRANPEIKKYNAVVKKIYVLGLGRAQDNYQATDGRMLRIVGKNGQDTLKALDRAKFTGSYDVRVQRSTALSESKPLRLQQLTMMKQNFPDAISDKQLLEAMEMADTEQFFDVVTASTNMAQAENDNLISGEIVLPPEEWEDHLSHWNVHAPKISTLYFKEDVSPEAQQAFKEHIEATEYFLFEKAKTNAALLTKLLSLELFPLFFKLPIPLITLAQIQQSGQPVDEALAQRAAIRNMGPLAAPPSPEMAKAGEGGSPLEEPAPIEEPTSLDTAPGVEPRDGSLEGPTDQANAAQGLNVA